MANPTRILTHLTASKDAIFQEKLTVTGQTNLNGVVNLGDASTDIVTATGQFTASAGVNISNGLTSVGGASVGGVATFTQTGTNAFSFAGSGSVQGKLTVYGGLNVQGDIDYLTTTNLDVLDQKITIAKGASDLTGEPGIYVGSDTNPLAYVGIKSADNGWHISSSGGTFIAATGSNFDNIGAGLVSAGEFNVEKVFRAVDTKLSSTTTISTIRTEYDKLRFVTTGSLETGTATVQLNKAAFENANKDFITLDVMVRDNNDHAWTNDLVSVYLQTGSTYVDVKIDAPGAAAAGWQYKLIAVNENTGTLGVV